MFLDEFIITNSYVRLLYKESRKTDCSVVAVMSCLSGNYYYIISSLMTVIILLENFINFVGYI